MEASHVDLTHNLLAKLNQPPRRARYHGVEVSNVATQTEVSEVAPLRLLLRNFSVLRTRVAELATTSADLKLRLQAEFSARIAAAAAASQAKADHSIAAIRAAHDEHLADVRAAARSHVRAAVAAVKADLLATATAAAAAAAGAATGAARSDAEADGASDPGGRDGDQQRVAALEAELADLRGGLEEKEKELADVRAALETHRAQVAAYNATLQSTLETLAEAVEARKLVPKLEEQIRTKNQTIAQLVQRINDYHAHATAHHPAPPPNPPPPSSSRRPRRGPPPQP